MIRDVRTVGSRALENAEDKERWLEFYSDNNPEFAWLDDQAKLAIIS